MEVWKKLDNEPEKQYKAFLKYLKAPEDRKLSKIAKFFKVRPATISIWISKYNWKERIEAYDKHQETQVEAERKVLIKESAYKINNDLINYINTLMVVPEKYREKLATKKGIEWLDGLGVSDLREMAGEDAEVAVKLIKAYKEFLGLIPEGREILEEEKKGDNVTIIINSVTNNTIENKDDGNTIDVTPKKDEEGKKTKQIEI